MAWRKPLSQGKEGGKGMSHHDEEIGKGVLLSGVPRTELRPDLYPVEG